MTHFFLLSLRLSVVSVVVDVVTLLLLDVATDIGLESFDLPQ